jgi:SAM-dependent methyltransferase
MNTADPSHAQEGGIPAGIYDVGFGWDPEPEIDRLLFGCRQAGCEPQSALELGCGTGRLLRALRKRLPDVVGLDLNPAMVAFARLHGTVPVLLADMSDFACGGTFDLIYASANTIRCVTESEAIRRMWRRIAGHLNPGGVFIADVELGFAAEAEKVGQPVRWMMSRGEALVHVTWQVIQPPDPNTRCSSLAWTFELRRGDARQSWHEKFCLRTYDASEFLGIAATEGGLSAVGLYELRDPYLFETPAEKANGRMLVVLKRKTDVTASGGPTSGRSTDRPEARLPKI